MNARIAAYTYNADIYCSLECVRDTMIKRRVLMPAAAGTPALDVMEQLASMRGIDPEHEWTYDSDEYPKVVFADQLDWPHDHCGRCLLRLG